MRTLLFVLMFSLVAGFSFAQKKDATPEERAKRQTKRLSKELNLSLEQSTKLEAASLERINAVKAAKDSKNKEGIKTARQTFENKVKEILTPDQWTKFQAKREEMIDKQAEKKLEKMKTELSLTDEQTTQLAAIMESHLEELEETPAGGGAKKAVMEKFEAELKKILSEEQFKKYQSMKEERKEKRKN